MVDSKAKTINYKFTDGTESGPIPATDKLLESIQENFGAKGLIEDEVKFESEKYWAKWDKIDQSGIENIIYTFYEVYFRNSVEPDQFGELLDEMIRLLSKALEESKAETKGESKEIETAMGVETTKETIKEIKKLITGVVSKSKDIEPGERSKSVAKERSTKSGGEFEAAMKSLDDYIGVQKLLRTITTATQKGLEAVNKRIQDETKK